MPPKFSPKSLNFPGISLLTIPLVGRATTSTYSLSSQPAATTRQYLITSRHDLSSVQTLSGSSALWVAAECLMHAAPPCAAKAIQGPGASLV